ncbi:MAG TPA: nickel-responsive transcriptional regulator NikR [Kiritimatiellia bacterium]|nr:nickel-responsive transcriptional regulator NikR [Kiritimatiellia bacterium]HMO99079.1 nickel-responsive transcriptional regulator NikR [Kiritimatiellia bacterium]HMP96609.1 nickel-responsive transcriptional regulator NikR [Kiritimatiellia bacterium]
MLERFSISIDRKLIAAFDRHIKAKKYRNRSEAIRDLIRKALIRQEWDADEEVVGVVTLVFNHHQRQLQDTMTELQHDHHHLVVSTTHIHLGKHDCLEVIIARGKASRVQSLAESLIALRGVKDGSLTMSSAGASLS